MVTELNLKDEIRNGSTVQKVQAILLFLHRSAISIDIGENLAQKRVGAPFPMSYY
jgi:hypothetical protein